MSGGVCGIRTVCKFNYIAAVSVRLTRPAVGRQTADLADCQPARQ